MANLQEASSAASQSLIQTDSLMLLTSESSSSEPSQSEEPSKESKRRRLGSSDPASMMFREVFANGVALFFENDVKARHGDATGVHQLRTSTRRLRAFLELFETLCDPEWTQALEVELKWLSAALGRIRDVDVLKLRFQREAESIDSIQSLTPFFERLDDRRHIAAVVLGEVFESERYHALSARLSEESVNAPLISDADEPCGKVLPRLVLATWKRLRKSGRQMTISDPDEAFHDLRKRAKRARYAAEAVSVALDEDERRAAKNFARKARVAQDVLGEHQDAVVAAGALRDAVEEFPNLGRLAFAAGRLLEREVRAAELSKERFFDVFPDIDRKKVVRWLYQ